MFKEKNTLTTKHPNLGKKSNQGCFADPSCRSKLIVFLLLLKDISNNTKPHSLWPKPFASKIKLNFSFFFKKKENNKNKIKITPRPQPVPQLVLIGSSPALGRAELLPKRGIRGCWVLPKSSPLWGIFFLALCFLSLSQAPVIYCLSALQTSDISRCLDNARV